MITLREMKILYRYILTQLLGPFLLGVGIFSLILLLAFIFELVEGVVVKGIPPGIAILALFLYLPATLAYTIPMAALMANLVTWGQLKERGEITAIRASGISLAPAILLVVITALFLSLVLYLVSDLLLSRFDYKEFWAKGIQAGQGIPLEERVFIKVSRFEFFIDRLNKEKRCMEGVYIYDSGKGVDSPSMIIFSRSGEYRLEKSPMLVSVEFLLRDGSIHQMDKDDPTRYHILRFKTKTLNISAPIELKGREIAQMSLSELREKIKRFRRSGLDPAPLAVELHKKQAVPFALLTFTLIGIPLGLSIRRSSGTLGFGMSLLLVFIYYVLLIGGESLALRGYLPVNLALWMANIVLFFVGSILIMRVLRP